MYITSYKFTRERHYCSSHETVRMVNCCRTRPLRTFNKTFKNNCSQGVNNLICFRNTKLEA